MIKIILTGADGYIGHCFYKLYKKKFNILPIDKKKKHNKDVIICNLNNTKKLSSILGKFKPHVTVHLAAQSLVSNSIPKSKYVNDNTNATKNLLLILKKNKLNNIIFSSTAALYKSSNNPLNEKSKLNPLSNYAKTKFRCETLINKSKLNYVIFRFFNACSAIKKFNVGELHNPETHLVPKLVWQSLNNKIIKIYGTKYRTKDGTAIRDYTHVEDICLAIHAIITSILKSKKNYTVNIGSSNGFSVLEMTKYLQKLLKENLKIKYTKPRKNDAEILICNNSKIKKIINWKPKKSNLKNIFKDEIYWARYLMNRKIKRKLSNL
jgi:UDP-glucose 4-epimerase